MATLFHTNLPATRRTACSYTGSAAWTAAPVAMSRQRLVTIERTRGALDAGEINALGARCAR